MRQDTVMNVAEAITAALEIDTEIIDHKLEIIGGTGRYSKKIGHVEEGGDLDSGLIYSRLLKSGEKYICTDPANDPIYKPQEEEKAEICCPIILDKRVVGLIGLVAFTTAQRDKIIKNSESLTTFLERMADLIASKLSDTVKRLQLKGIVESMHDGLIAINKDQLVVSCNHKCEKLLGLSRNNIENKLLPEVWKIPEVEKVIQSGIPVKDKEITYKSKNNRDRGFLGSIIPLNINDDVEEDISAQGAILLFQNISDARERLYRMTVNEKNTTFLDIIGESEAILTVKRRTLQVAPSDSTVLITGESGTGKELFARAIHFSSPRKNHPFVAINCGAIPEMLLESELFGYEKGAFTGADNSGKPGKFEIAHKGTIFLDEIGDLPLHLQVKLLHAIQNRQIERIGGINPIDVDVRIIAATNKNLERMILSKEFREDLYFRLNVIPLNIPPLRERTGDIELLLTFALKKFNGLLNKNIEGFHTKALQLLLQYHWPGNVRELENVVEYAVNMEEGVQIRKENLPEKIWRGDQELKLKKGGLKERLDDYQRTIIEECLDETGRSTEGKIHAARLLGISESTLYRRIRELGIKG